MDPCAQGSVHLVVATINARWRHCSHALRCLYANLGPWQAGTRLREYTLDQQPETIVEDLLRGEPRVVALSCVIWNTALLARVAAVLKSVAPEVRVLVGGPEITADWQPEALRRHADHLLVGEGELFLPQVLDRLHQGVAMPQVLHAPAPRLADVVLPYAAYSDADLAERIVYLEATRGCPYTCAFCASARDTQLRRFPLARFLAAWDDLIARGCTAFKFLDRSFNADTALCDTLLDHFLARYAPGMLLHAEFVPDRLAMSTRERLSQASAGSLHVEVGLQSLDPEVLAGIDRRTDMARAWANLEWLRECPAVDLHVDLIVGLPGETEAGFQAGFDRLWYVRPDAIQVGILKRLAGTPLADRNDAGCFDAEPPYSLLANTHFPFSRLQRYKRLARVVELYVNRPGFTRSLDLLAGQHPCRALLHFADWLERHVRRQHGISLVRQYQAIIAYLCEQGHQRDVVFRTVALDFDARDSDSGLPQELAPAVQQLRRERLGSA